MRDLVVRRQWVREQSVTHNAGERPPETFLLPNDFPREDIPQNHNLTTSNAEETDKGEKKYDTLSVHRHSQRFPRSLGAFRLRNDLHHRSHYLQDMSIRLARIPDTFAHLRWAHSVAPPSFATSPVGVQVSNREFFPDLKGESERTKSDVP